MAAVGGGLRWRTVAVFALATCLACGPWFLEHWALTGNPTYPLLYEVFGGETRTPEKDAQWRSAHAPHNFSAPALAADLAQVGWRSPWLGAVTLPLAVVALTAAGRRQIAPLWGLVLFVVGAWWLATHRIDRFWVPALAILSLLAGVGLKESAAGAGRWAAALLSLVAVLWGMTASVPPGAMGDQRLFVSLDRLRTDPVRVNPVHLWLNAHGRPDEAVLLVGDVQPFDLEIPVLYSTVFDDCVFEQIVRGRTPDEVRKELADRNVRYVFVRWNEIARYRAPGNYGFSPFVQPAVFDQLVDDGVLHPMDPVAWEHLGTLYEVAGGR
jgi:hypothetical protein